MTKRAPSPEERKPRAGKPAVQNRTARASTKPKAKAPRPDTSEAVRTENPEGAKGETVPSASPESFPVGSRVWCVSSSMYAWRRGWVRDHRDGSLSVGVEFDFDRGNIVPFSPRELQILP
jgi:hypothetical protein